MNKMLQLLLLAAGGGAVYWYARNAGMLGPVGPYDVAGSDPQHPCPGTLLPWPTDDQKSYYCYKNPGCTADQHIEHAPGSDVLSCATSAPPVAIPSGSGTAVVVPTSGTTSGGAPVLDAKAKVAAALQTAGLTQGNVDVLGYYYAQALGHPAPAPEDYGIPSVGQAGRDTPYTLDQWWAKLPPSALSGLGVWITRGNAPVQFRGLGAGIWGYGRGYVRSAN